MSTTQESASGTSILGSIDRNHVFSLLGDDGVIFIACSIAAMIVGMIGYYALIRFLGNYFNTNIFRKIDRWLTILIVIVLMILAPLVYWFFIVPASALASGDTSALLQLISN